MLHSCPLYNPENHQSDPLLDQIHHKLVDEGEVNSTEYFWLGFVLFFPPLVKVTSQLAETLNIKMTIHPNSVHVLTDVLA